MVVGQPTMEMTQSKSFVAAGLALPGPRSGARPGVGGLFLVAGSVPIGPGRGWCRTSDPSYS